MNRAAPVLAAEVERVVRSTLPALSAAVEFGAVPEGLCVVGPAVDVRRIGILMRQCGRDVVVAIDDGDKRLEVYL